MASEKQRSGWGIVGVLLLLLWGGVLVGMVATGRVIHYLDTPFRIQGLIAGLGLVVLALFCFATRKVTVGGCGCGNAPAHPHDAHDHHHDHHHDHADGAEEDHGHDLLFDGGIVALLVLALPLTMAVLRSPDEYSISWMQKREKLMSVVSVGSMPEGVSKLADASAAKAEAEDPDMEVTLADVDAMVKKNDAGEYQLSVLELFYVGNDDAFANVLGGVKLETTGQVVRERLNNPDGTRLRVFRLFVQCCAADARPMSVPVRFSGGAPEFKEMGWYAIHGTLDFEEVNGQRIAVVRAESMEPVPEPEQRVAY